MVKKKNSAPGFHVHLNLLVFEEFLSTYLWYRLLHISYTFIYCCSYNCTFHFHIIAVVLKIILKGSVLADFRSKFSNLCSLKVIMPACPSNHTSACVGGVCTSACVGGACTLACGCCRSIASCHDLSSALPHIQQFLQFEQLKKYHIRIPTEK